MVSLDTPEQNAEFAHSLGAKHVVLSDHDKRAANAYGVVALGGLYARRWTFYIDRAGKIAAIDRAVNTASAGQDIARKLGEFGFPRRAPTP